MDFEILKVFAIEGGEKTTRVKQWVRGIGDPSSVYSTLHSKERVGRTHFKSDATEEVEQETEHYRLREYVNRERETQINWTVGWPIIQMWIGNS